MSQIENQWEQIKHIETGIMRHMLALGLDWNDEVAMARLARECKTFSAAHAQAVYASGDRTRKTRAELFAMVSIMIKTMEEAANENRDVHGGEVWKAFAKHLYS